MKSNYKLWNNLGDALKKEIEHQAQKFNLEFPKMAILFESRVNDRREKCAFNTYLRKKGYSSN